VCQALCHWKESEVSPARGRMFETGMVHHLGFHTIFIIAWRELCRK